MGNNIDCGQRAPVERVVRQLEMVMTQTNGLAQEMPTLAAMLEAVGEIERETHRAPTEYKIHPEDWDELRTQLKPHMITSAALRRPPEIFGLRIILDYTAVRLPRKVPNVPGKGLAATNATEGDKSA